MDHGVCPWWVGYILASPLRRLLQDPVRLLTPYVRAGMVVLEPGPGMGFFTFELARLVGPSGRVIAVDVQPKMIAGLKRRARKAGLLERIDACLAQPASMGLIGLDDAIDFIFAFAVVHELPSSAAFFAEAARVLKSGATLLLVEPAGHVTEAEFKQQLAAGAQNGLTVTAHPFQRRCRTALLSKRAA